MAGLRTSEPSPETASRLPDPEALGGDRGRYVWPSAKLVDDPRRWARRGVYALLLAGAAAFVVYAFNNAPRNDVAMTRDPAVVRQLPAPGAHILHQAQVGAILRVGYDGRIAINGIAIPEDQMDGAVPASSPVYDPRLGSRPNRRNEVLFTPGKGKVIDHYGTGDVTIVVRYWKIADGPSRARSVAWRFSVN